MPSDIPNLLHQLRHLRILCVRGDVLLWYGIELRPWSDMLCWVLE